MFMLSSLCNNHAGVVERSIFVARVFSRLNFDEDRATLVTGGKISKYAHKQTVDKLSIKLTLVSLDFVACSSFPVKLLFGS